MSVEPPRQLVKVFVWVLALIYGGIGVLAIRFGTELRQTFAGIPLILLAIWLVRWAGKWSESKAV